MKFHIGGGGGGEKFVCIVKFELKSNKKTDVSHDGVHTFMAIFGACDVHKLRHLAVHETRTRHAAEHINAILCRPLEMLFVFNLLQRSVTPLG